MAPDGRAEAAGTSLAEPTTLEAAIERVVTGDAIVMRGGTYRTGGLRLNQGITLQPYADERPVLKGTHVATEWQALRGKVWRTSWKTLFPAKPLGWWQRAREGMRTPLHRFNNDMVFVDGELLKSAGWEGELDEHSFYVDYDAGHVYIGTDPTNRLVEITAFDGALLRTTASVPRQGVRPEGPGDPRDHVHAVRLPCARGRGQAQLRPDGGADRRAARTRRPLDLRQGGHGHHARERDDLLLLARRRLLPRRRPVLRNSLISDTSTEGFYVIGSSDVLLEQNIFRRNNVEELTGYYPAAVKIFNQSHRVTCRDNLVIDNPIRTASGTTSATSTVSS